MASLRKINALRRFVVLDFVEREIGHLSQDRAIRHGGRHAEFKFKLNIINEANSTGGENVGGTTAAPAAPEAASDDDDGGGGDSDPEPERRRPGRPRNTRKTRTTSPAGTSPASSAAQAADALIQFDTRPAASFVRLPVVCSLFACSPATAWRWVKSGKIPSPVKLSERVTAWRVGDLRAALAQLAA